MITTQTIKNKKTVEKITMLTAYDYQTASILDNAGVDMILVGDSLGNVILGYPDTTFVTLDDMIRHTAAVTRGAKNAFVVADMPFLTYNLSIEKTLINAGKLITSGAKAVKLEGGEAIIPHVKALCDAGIPVCGHLGLTPQSVNQLGGYRVQGKTEQQAMKLIADSLLLQEAGAFAIVLECIPSDLAIEITKKLTIPTIGIGAGNGTDGQVLVINDMLGITEKSPSFVKRYANVGEIMKKSAEDYINEVKASLFPQK